MNSIDKKPGISQRDFIKNYLNPGIPVIIPGAMREWKAYEKWDPSYFRDHLGDKKVRVQGVEMVLRDFMDTVLASDVGKPSKYLNEVNIHHSFRELIDDVNPFFIYAQPDRLMTSFMPGSWGMRNGVVELLIGGKGTKFPTIHYDGYHMNTFVTQIRGDKEFIFFAPDQTKYMYPTHDGSNKSQVNDAFTPDLDKYPLFAQAKPIKVIVKEGETVFLPSGWWHTTRLLSLSIAVSTNNINPLLWNDFVDDFSKDLSQSKLKQNVYKIYLKSAGILLSMAGK